MSTPAPPTDDWHPWSLGRGGGARPALGRLSQPFPAGAAPALWAGEGCQAGGAACRCAHPPGLHLSHLRPGPQDVPLCPRGARALPGPVLPGGRLLLARLRGLACSPLASGSPQAPLLYRGWDWALQPCTFGMAALGPWGVLGLELSTSPDSNPGSCDSGLGAVPCPLWASVSSSVKSCAGAPASQGCGERAEAQARDPAGLGGRQAESTITTSL